MKYPLNGGCSQNQNHLASLPNEMESIKTKHEFRVLLIFSTLFLTFI